MKKTLTRNILLTLLATTSFAANAVVTNNVPSALSSGKTFKIRGLKMNSVENPFKATIASYNQDGSLGDQLDLTDYAKFRKLTDGSYIAKILMPSVKADLKVKLNISGGNVPELNAQEYIALLLSDPNSQVNLELENEGFVLVGSDPNQAKDGANGIDGINGKDGATGPKGDPGAIAIDGGVVDIDPLFNLFTGDIPGLFRTIVDGVYIDLQGASYFKVIDSNLKTQDIIGNIKGVTTPGHKVTILFENEALVTNTEGGEAWTINLAEAVPSKIRSPFSNSKSLSLTPGTHFETFGPDSTLELLFDGNSWFELNRSNTKDPSFVKY